MKCMIKAITKTESDPLTVEEKQLIQSSWTQLGHSADMITDFYNQLFNLYPRLRPLFKEDIRLQSRKFTAHISYLISHIHDWKRLEGDLDELGKRHINYEVKPEYFDYVKEALFPAMKKHMGEEEWNESIEQAWTKFYRLVTTRMITAGRYLHSN